MDTVRVQELKAMWAEAKAAGDQVDPANEVIEQMIGALDSLMARMNRIMATVPALAAALDGFVKREESIEGYLWTHWADDDLGPGWNTLGWEWEDMLEALQTWSEGSLPALCEFDPHALARALPAVMLYRQGRAALDVLMLDGVLSTGGRQQPTDTV